MAMGKKVKRGGVYYKGYKLTVSAAAADYVLDMTQTKQYLVSGITVVPTQFGDGDSFKLERTDSDDNILNTFAKAVFNIGALSAWHFDFATLEPFEANDKLKLTYTNTAGIAMNVYTCVEIIK